MKAAWNRVNEVIFGYGSPVAIGVFRAIFCGLTTINLLLVALHFESWYTEKGYVPWKAAEMWAGNGTYPSLLHGVTDTRTTAVIYAIIVLSAALSCVGLFTRPATILLAIGYVSLNHRMPFFLHGGDTLSRSVLVYLAVAPSGASFSLDRLIKCRKTGDWTMPQVSLWPQRLLQYQWALLYFTTAWAKAYGSFWRDGTATWYPVNMPEFRKFGMPMFFDSQPMLSITTYGTLLIEVALATLVFAKPYRKWVLIGGLILHASIEFRLNIPLFAFLMTSGYILFYGGEEITAWAGKLADRWPNVPLLSRMARPDSAAS